MYDPKDILIKPAYHRYLAKLIDLQDIIWYITDHSDDLHIDEEALEALQEVESLLPYFREGDGEVDEY